HLVTEGVEYPFGSPQPLRVAFKLLRQQFGDDDTGAECTDLDGRAAGFARKRPREKTHRRLGRPIDRDTRPDATVAAEPFHIVNVAESLLQHATNGCLRAENSAANVGINYLANRRRGQLPDRDIRMANPGIVDPDVNRPKRGSGRIPQGLISFQRTNVAVSANEPIVAVLAAE